MQSQQVFLQSKLGKFAEGFRDDFIGEVAWSSGMEFGWDLEDLEEFSQREAMPKNAQTTAWLHSSHASKVMLKILQASLQQYMNRELPDVQAGFIKGRGTRDQIANICWIIEKAREFQKNIYFLLYWLCQSLWLCGSQ